MVSREWDRCVCGHASGAHELWRPGDPSTECLLMCCDCREWVERAEGSS